MSFQAANLRSLFDEYRMLVNACEAGPESPSDEIDGQRLADLLVTEAAWTEPGAQLLIQLATYNGSFILRNATALALALGIEDGEGGY